MSSASLVEGLGVERIHFPRLVGRELNGCGIDVVAVGLEVVDKSAHVLAVVLEEKYKPCLVQLSGRP